MPEKQEYPSPLFTKYVTKALLAKLYLYQKDNTNALKYAKEIIDSKKFSLYNHNSDIYMMTNFYNNKESLSLSGALFNMPPTDDDYIYIQKGDFTPSIHFAEILLIAAEASSNLKEKIQYINKLRSRNHRPTLREDATLNDCNQAIIEEYKLDLGKEGLYFFALKRFNIVEQTLNTNHILLPLPDNIYELIERILQK